MFSIRQAVPMVARTASRHMSNAAAGMTLTFSVPHQNIYDKQSVDRVIIPGLEGEYGVTAGHTPLVAQLKPGIVKIIHSGSSDPESFFISGGFALTHEDSSTDINAAEAVKVDDIDADAVRSSFSAAKSAFESSDSGSMANAEAQVQMETCKAMASALGFAL